MGGPASASESPVMFSMSAAGRALLWRVHGLAALLASPLLLIALLTGLIYLPTPQVEAWQVHEALRPAQHGPALPLDALLAAAPSQPPLRQIELPAEPGQALRLQLGGGRGHHAAHGLSVWLDPATGAELGRLADAERYGAWANKLHSQLRLGEGWRWLIELAASGLLLMLLTGLLLALPLKVRGLRRWHALGGLLLLGLTLAITLTGLTWSQTAGAQVRQLRDWGQWNAPRPPSGLHSAGTVASAQAVLDAARAALPGRALLLTPPARPGAPWLVQTAERERPWAREQLALDAVTAEVRWRSGFADAPWFAQATAVGIPFHRGELGLWNQALLLLFALGLLGSIASGWWMVMRRWRAGGALLPRASQRSRRAWVLLLPALAACALFPLLIPFVVVALLVEAWPRPLPSPVSP